MTNETLIISDDIYYPGILAGVRKSKEPLQPIYEAFTNAFESLKSSFSNTSDGKISICLFLNSGTTTDDFIFDYLTIEDNGSGFNDINFDRFKKYRDTRKGFHNKGTGRIQFMHFFDTACFDSTFKENGNYCQRTLTLSKKYMSQNAIISHVPPVQVNANATKTVLTLRVLLDQTKDQRCFDKITAQDLKQKLINRYMMEFCAHRQNFPTILIKEYINGKEDSVKHIRQEDIPQIDQEKDVEISYHKLSNDGSSFVPTENKESLKLFAFKIAADSLEKNEIKLTSKGEIANEPKVDLEGLPSKDSLDNNRYLFLLAGDYLNNRDTDTRGTLNILTRKAFKKENSANQELLTSEEIFLDDIQFKANETIPAIYKEIRDKIEDKQQDVEELREMFLLNKETINAVTLSLNDSEEKILEKVYAADAKIIAHKDAEIKECIDKLETLDPNSDDYLKRLNTIASELVTIIPLQNRSALTHYIARRKLVLEVFDKILNNELSIQKSGKRNVDEQLLHNLIFQQSSNEPEKSDLWLINEDFIYFKGASEQRLCDIEIDGKKVLNEQFSEKEEEYLLSLGENRKIKKPDILLFPAEGKCIVIELKNPDVNVSDHIAQINKYAFLIRNYSNAELHLETFYGFLIGEKFNTKDVRSADSYFQEAYHFDYLFRPHYPIPGEDGRRDGSLYTEIIQYSTLLHRAMKRNQIFIDKLTKANS